MELVADGFGSVGYNARGVGTSEVINMEAAAVHNMENWCWPVVEGAIAWTPLDDLRDGFGSFSPVYDHHTHGSYRVFY